MKHAIARRSNALLGVGLGTIGMLAVASSVAHASDTVETWDVGASDVDFYLGLDGMRSDATGAFGDIMLGYGIRPRLSAYLGATLRGERTSASGDTTIYLGVFGTLLDTRHVDLDVFLNFANGGPSMSQFELAPALELNLDHDPGMNTWGLYLRSSVPVHSRQAQGGGAMSVSETAVHVASTVGTYRTIATGHQLLLEYSFDYHPRPADGERTVEVGGVAAGYNVVIGSGLELITEVFVDVPQSGESTSFRVMTGFIATLPGTAGVSK